MTINDVKKQIKKEENEKIKIKGTLKNERHK